MKYSTVTSWSSLDIIQHVYSAPLSRIQSPNLNEEEYRRYDPSLCSKQGNETRNLRAGLHIPGHNAGAHFSYPVLLHGYKCTTEEEESASSDRCGGMGKPWPSIVASGCCVGPLLLCLPAYLPLTSLRHTFHQFWEGKW